MVEQARALESQGVGGIPAYRRLLDEWKLAGRAGKRYDDALWAQFKAAGDVLYGAKAEVDAADDEEQQANLQAKLALLDEAEPILQITERTAARDKLTAVQLRWDAVGRVPRDSVKTVEDRLRKVEAHVRTLDEEFWRKNNPETKARSEGLASQLGAAIDKLQREARRREGRGRRPPHRRGRGGARRPPRVAGRAGLLALLLRTATTGRDPPRDPGPSSVQGRHLAWCAA
ncbi:DUF349 domain-containing protein [Clavibacter tessellarius]